MTRASASRDPTGHHALKPGELKRLLSAQRKQEPFLAYRGKDGHLELFPLLPKAPTVTLGRRHQADVSLPWDSEVSGVHAELARLGGEWTIVDDGLSTNGTYVGERRVNGRQRLHDGDRIRVGCTVLAYYTGERDQVEETVDAADLAAVPPLTETQRRVLIGLCRPYREDERFATPASNGQIAEEVFLTVNAVKLQLRTLFERFGLSGLPQNEKRARLAEAVLQKGVISRNELT